MAKWSWWKVLGAAGLVSVAATGVLVARQERTRRAYTPEEIRSRLHSRYAQLARDARSGRVDSSQIIDLTGRGQNTE